MAVRSREEIMTMIQGRFGDSSDDETISILEDITDTFADLESKAGEVWKTKYEENDAEWRRKYTERFYSPAPEPTPPAEPVATEEPEMKTFEDLFKQD